MTEGEFFRDLKIDDLVKSLQRDGKEKSSPALAGDFLRSHQNIKLTMEETSAIFPAGRSKAESIGQEPPHKIYRIVAPGVNRGWIKGFNTGIAPR
jgi:hypothetical protein